MASFNIGAKRIKNSIQKPVRHWFKAFKGIYGSDSGCDFLNWDNINKILTIIIQVTGFGFHEILHSLINVGCWLRFGKGWGCGFNR